MASEINSTAASRISPSDSQNKTLRFAVCETIALTERGEDESWDDTDWQDYLSQFSDTGVGR